MYCRQWQIGIDIQKNSICAVMVQQRRDGWQLRGWWQHPFDVSDGLMPTSLLLEQALAPLSQWRKSLPKHITVRIALPVSLVLQQYLPLPEYSLSEAELTWFIEASLEKLFPLPAKELVFDYQKVEKQQSCQQQLLITAARFTELNRWVAMLTEAGLKPEVVDIAPSILRFMALQAQQCTDALLIHGCYDEILVASPVNHDFYFSVLTAADLVAEDYERSIIRLYHDMTGCSVSSVCYSGDFSALSSHPFCVNTWSPFNVISRLSPPLPHQPGGFVIACGLALRPEN